jgi:hypothetical protein
MVRASRSQLPASRGATETICASVCIRPEIALGEGGPPPRCAGSNGLGDCPDSVFDLGFQPTALSASSDRLEWLVGGQRR